MTTTPKITIQDVQAEIRRLASEKPNYVYSSSTGVCMYVDTVDGKKCGSCIVGQALINTGAIDIDVLHEKYELLGSYRVLRDLFGGDNDWDVSAWIRSVQLAQDGKAPWGVAVARADRHNQ